MKVLKMHFAQNMFFVTMIHLLMLFVVCAAEGKEPKPVEGAVAALDRKVAAWNKNELQKVLDAYDNSAELSVLSSGKDLYGKENMIKRYQGWYGKDPRLMGTIGYSELKSVKLGGNSILLTGHYSLDEPNEKPAQGVFTLVYEKRGSAWKIVHEHLSKSNISQ